MHTPAKLGVLKRLKPKMNFITLHCKCVHSINTSLRAFCVKGRKRKLTLMIDTYIITMALLGSVLIYPAGDMAYVDALFFGSGAATQSGLNT